MGDGRGFRHVMKCHVLSLGVRFTPSRHSDRRPESRPGSVGMTDERSGRDGDLRCHEMSCSVTIRCCRAFAVYRRPGRTDHSIYHVFLHPPFRPKPHRRPGRRKPPPAENAFCSYIVLMRVSSVFCGVAVRVPAWGFPLRKGKGCAAAPCFAFSGFRRGTRFSGGSAGAKAEAMGVIRSAARTAFRRCAADAAPTPPGARKARRPPLLKKGGTAPPHRDRPCLTPHRPVPMFRPSEPGPKRPPPSALGAHSSAGRATDF